MRTANPSRPRRRDLGTLLAEVRACEVCTAHLPLGPRPLVQVGSTARIVIIGQAPGRRVHESGTLWADPSGDRLRDWLGLDEERFYDDRLVALVPMGFCYPGSSGNGDLPPRPECAPLWHGPLLDHLADDRLEVIIGAHAQRRYVERRGTNLTETVASWADHLPRQIVLPHPSPRNQSWFSKNPWFAAETVPAVRARTQEILDARDD
jgi:uracil-DNA glycosylase